MIGEPEDGLKVGQTVPAITSNETPESIGDATVGLMESVVAPRRKCDAPVNESNVNGLSVVLSHRRERARKAVVAGDEVQDEIPVAAASQRVRAEFLGSGNHGRGLHLVPGALRILGP